MRTRPSHLISFALLALSTLLLASQTPQEGFAQKRGGKGGGGKGGFKFDPSQFFDRMSNGESYIVIAVQQRGKDQMEEFAKKEGITNGKLTREQFVKYMEQQMQNWQQKGGGKGGGKGGRGGPDAESIFKKYDTNGDGKLNETEIAGMSNFHDEFKADWKKYDTNKDGLIALDEYKVYLEARMKAREDRKNGDKKDEAKKDGDAKGDDKKDDAKKDGDKKAEAKPSVLRIEIDDIEDVKPVVYRAGNLPKELPDWFQELDTNKDGQVSLMEWVKGSKSISEFVKLDRNDDGLLTPEEVLRFQRLAAGLPANGEVVAANSEDGPGVGGQRPGGKGGFGKGGFGKGGKGGFGKGGFGKGGKGGKRGNRPNQD